MRPIFAMTDYSKLLPAALFAYTNSWLALLKALSPIPRTLRALLGLGLATTVARGEVSWESFGEGTNKFTIQFVTVGAPGNSDDPAGVPYPMGGVSYGYRIGTYEVSEAMMALANTLGDLGITFSSAGGKQPATMVTFYEVARFVNWLNTSRGYPPAYRFNDKGEWLLWSPDEAWRLDGFNLYRHKDAFFFLPSADEWYKAAYFNGTNYYRYATGSNRTPVPVPSGTEPGTTVYNQPEDAGPAPVDEAGGLSPSGTMAQGGNVWEWIETAYDGVNDATDELLQIRGGRWAAGLSSIRAASCNAGRPWSGVTATTGFRVAARLSGGTPMAPELTLRPDPDGRGLELSWVSQTGVEYDLERSASPAGGFITFDTLSGTGGVLRYVFRPMQEGEAFYRVVAVRIGL